MKKRKKLGDCSNNTLKAHSFEPMVTRQKKSRHLLYRTLQVHMVMMICLFCVLIVMVTHLTKVENLKVYKERVGPDKSYFILY